MYGYSIRMAAGARTTMSSMVQPFKCISTLCPATIPPPGLVITLVIPLARVTGMCSLAGLTAVAARNCGLNNPISAMSLISRTASISVRPISVDESIIPG